MLEYQADRDPVPVYSETVSQIDSPTAAAEHDIRADTVETLDEERSEHP